MEAEEMKWNKTNMHRWSVWSFFAVIVEDTQDAAGRWAVWVCPVHLHPLNTMGDWCRQGKAPVALSVCTVLCMCGVSALETQKEPQSVNLTYR